MIEQPCSKDDDSDALAQRRDKFWKRIIEFISHRELVPIVGQELLWYPDANLPNCGISMYDLLAKKFATELGLQIPTGQNRSALSALVASHPAFKDNAYEAYEDLKDVYERSSFQVPVAIRQLAEIRAFRVFVTTTFDDSLERALNEVRYGGRERTIVLTYSLRKRPHTSTIDEAIGSGDAVVFKLFGSIDRPLNGYAVTEADYVEFMHSLQSKELRPERLFDELKEKHVLLLGNSFPDWIARFFLRLTRHYPLASSQGSTIQYLADAIFSQDPLLLFFLNRYTKMAEVVPEVSAIEFVNHLHKRLPSSDQEEPQEIGDDEMEAGGVFISYSTKDDEGAESPDVDFVLRLKDALESLGIATWLDRRGGLQYADLWERKIKRNIARCSLFVPIVSLTSNRRTEGFFRKEWAWAIERSLLLTGADRPFLFPVVVDDIDLNSATNIPEEFRIPLAAQVSKQGPSQSFLSRFREVVRNVRKKDAQSL
jgi:SIR2-like protein/TIR domain-containing protein